MFDNLINIVGGLVQWKFCHFSKTGGIKADAWGEPHCSGQATLFNGIFFGLMFPLFSQFWEA
uniref:Alternative protein NEK9 n=1 Tax=Homo sapiens TaxID=9606 RepID=L8EAL4_HUMAN|nr:alternative protein NEK9 [Homo sapiens]